MATSSPTRDALRAAYKRILRTLRTERAMRDRVFPLGNPKRDQKLADIEQAIADLATLGEGLRSELDVQAPEAVQEKLIDVPQPGAY